MHENSLKPVLTKGTMCQIIAQAILVTDELPPIDHPTVTEFYIKPDFVLYPTYLLALDILDARVKRRNSK